MQLKGFYGSSFIVVVVAAVAEAYQSQRQSSRKIPEYVDWLFD